MSETQSDVHFTKLDEEISKLKEQLMLILTKLDIQQQAYLVKVAQEQDQRSKEKELLKALEQWKDEEKERQKAQMEEMREMMLKEFNKLSNMIDLLQDFLFYLSRLHSSSYVEEERNRKVEKLEQELQEQKELIVSQIEQIKKLSSSLPKQGVKSFEKKGEAKDQKSDLKRNQILKELGSLLLQAYVRELEPFYLDFYGPTERKPVTKQPAKRSLRRSFSEVELQYLLDQALFDKLEAMGAYRLPKVKVGFQRKKREMHFPRFQRIREKLAQALGRRLKERTGYSAPDPHARHRWASGGSLPSNFASRVVQVLPKFSLAQRSLDEDSEDEAPAQRPRDAAISVRRPAMPADSDLESMDGGGMEETTQEQVPRNKTTPQGEMITDFMRSLEKLFAERTSGKPEGANVLPNKNNVWQKSEDSEKDYDDDDDDDDDGDDDDDDDDDYNDVDSCSLEDRPPLTQPAPVTKSLESMRV